MAAPKAECALGLAEPSRSNLSSAVSLVHGNSCGEGNHVKLDKGTLLALALFGAALIIALAVLLWPVLSPGGARDAFDEARDQAYERRVVRDNQSIAQALSAMPQQGQYDLELFVESSLREAALAPPEQQQEIAIQRFEDIWHPGIAAMSNVSHPEGYAYGGVSIAACANVPRAIEPYYYSKRLGEPVDPNLSTDVYRVGEWAAATAAEIEGAQRGAQGVAIPAAYDGSDFIRDARPGFHKAWMYRDRDGDSKPILGLWAIDDGGSWWLVSATLP